MGSVLGDGLRTQGTGLRGPQSKQTSHLSKDALAFREIVLHRQPGWGSDRVRERPPHTSQALGHVPRALGAPLVWADKEQDGTSVQASEISTTPPPTLKAT